jgi:phosphohistidine swiveling domain-containing protein
MVKSDRQTFKKYLQRPWYIQGFSAVPIFLSIAGESGIFMKKYLGFNYQHFLFHYQDSYGEMAYDPADFKRLWQEVKNHLANQPNYLQTVKQEYLRNVRKYQPLLKKINVDYLIGLTDQRLLALLKKLLLAQQDNVGVSHIIDAVGVEIEEEFKQKLQQETPNSTLVEFNQIFTTLITPSRLPFVSQEERELLNIKNGVKNISGLKKHAAKYFWLENSFAGPKVLGPLYFQKKLFQLKKESRLRPSNKFQISKYQLSRSLKSLVKIIDYCAVWQDERKALILKNIHYLGLVLQEIARRFQQPVEDLYYLGFRESLKFKSFREVEKMSPKLKSRRRGCLVIIDQKLDRIVSGVDYKHLMSGRTSLLKDQTHSSHDLHGTVANTGTANGRVRIIKSVKTLSSFKKGEILVTSMTRPEFMTAIKKAAAIITDEGGLTCHAAIIARELNIPAVIGTKIATKVLRDGDWVEVKANHGIIKIVQTSSKMRK